jgi:hypothetical protein
MYLREKKKKRKRTKRKEKKGFLGSVDCAFY